MILTYTCYTCYWQISLTELSTCILYLHVLARHRMTQGNTPSVTGFCTKRCKLLILVRKGVNAIWKGVE